MIFNVERKHTNKEDDYPSGLGRVKSAVTQRAEDRG